MNRICLPQFQQLAAVILTLLISGIEYAQPVTQPAADPDRGSPSVAVPKSDPKARKRFLRLHAEYVDRAKQGKIDLLFLGASIVEGWNKVPQLWEKHYAALNAANFGISGDRVQHVLWRIENGELEGISPKVIVLMVGTNNSNSDDALPIVQGMRTLLASIHARTPNSRVLVLGILPRAKSEDKRQMGVITEVNRRLVELDDGNRVRFLDMSSRFQNPDGSINESLYRDKLHPSADGYEVWAQTMKPLLDEMMKASNQAPRKD